MWFPKNSNIKMKVTALTSNDIDVVTLKKLAHLFVF